VIRDATRASHVLVADPQLVASLGGVAALAGRQVSATGSLAGNTFTATALSFVTAAAPAAPALRAMAAAPAGTASKVVTIACKFSGADDLSPAANSPSYFAEALDAHSPHLGDYFSTVSRGRLVLDGTQVFEAKAGGFISVGPSVSYADGSGGFRTADIVDDCLVNAAVEWGDAFTAALQGAKAVAVALSHNLVANRIFGLTQALGDLGLGDATVPLTVVPPYLFQQQAGFAKSIGFALGMGESTTGALDPTVSPPADSPWDVMGGGWKCATLDPTFNCVAPRPLAVHLDQIGWIDASEKVEVSSGDQTVTLVAPSQTTGTRLATIPLGAGRYIAIETRIAASGDYDGNLPGSAVLVHDVVRRTSPADSPFVAHFDAALSAGSSYTDPATGAVIMVQAMGSASATVRVLHDVSLTLSAPSGGAITVDGASYRGTATLTERPNATVRLTLSPDNSHYYGTFQSGCSWMEGATCAVQMDQPREVDAKFTYVSGSSSGGGSGSGGSSGGHGCRIVNGERVCTYVP
jgi:hypothetical protein